MLAIVFVVGLVCAVFGAGVAVGAHNATRVATIVAAVHADIQRAEAAVKKL